MLPRASLGSASSGAGGSPTSPAPGSSTSSTGHGLMYEESKSGEPESTSEDRISSKRYYETYRGHPIDNLAKVLTYFKTLDKPLMYLAGDSSLDNKYWFLELPQRVKPVNGYETILEEGAQIPPDVAYQVNNLASTQGIHIACINAAVEESSLTSRMNGTKLLPQDEFIRDNITEKDILVISVGGNDIALSNENLMKIEPLLTATETELNDPTTITDAVRQNKISEALTFLDSIFKTSVETYIQNLCSIHRPHKILVCMVYYPDVNNVHTWANFLERIGYTSNPRPLQQIIAIMFQRATRN